MSQDAGSPRDLILQGTERGWKCSMPSVLHRHTPHSHIGTQTSEPYNTHTITNSKNNNTNSTQTPTTFKNQIYFQVDYKREN